MKTTKTLAALLLTLCLCSLASGQVIIWKQKVSDATPGAGFVQRDSISGYFIWCPNETKLLEIDAVKTSSGEKYLSYYTLGNWDVTYPLAAGGKHLMIISQTSRDYDGQNLSAL